MITERRQHHRKALTELISVELGSHNSGLILNASEGGLAFHAGSPIQAREEVRFAITLDRSRRLEGYGRLEWTDGNAKTAGLQFTEVSEEFRKEIRLWLAETDGRAEKPERATPDSEVSSYFVAANMLRPTSRVELPREELPREKEQPSAEMQQAPEQPTAGQPAAAPPAAAPKRKRKNRASHTTPSAAAPSVVQPTDAGPSENMGASSPIQPEEKAQPRPSEILAADHDKDSEEQPAIFSAGFVSTNPETRDKADAEEAQRASASLHKLAQSLERHAQQQAEELMAGLRGVAVESERHLTELQEFAQAQTDRMKDVLRQAGQVSQRLEQLSAELERVQQQKVNYFEAQLHDTSDRYIGELQQRADLLLVNAPSGELRGSSNRANGWMLTIMFVGLIVLLGAMLLSYHHEAGAAFSWIGEKLSGEPQQSEKPAAELQALEPKTPAPQPSAARPAMDKDAKALWSKAAKGDTAAEVALARLYLAGKGVVKSCVQARLLLGAAADKGNQDATQLLGQLEREGCP